MKRQALHVAALLALFDVAASAQQAPFGGAPHPPSGLQPTLRIGTTAGTVAAGNDPRFSGGTTVDSYGAAGDGVTYDDAAFTANAVALGPKCGTINLNPAKVGYHLHAGYRVPDGCTIKGQLILPDQAFGVPGGNLSALGSTLFVDSSIVTTTVGAAGLVGPSSTLPVASTAGFAHGMWIEGTGLYRGILVYGPNSVAKTLTLNFANAANVAAGTTITGRSLGIVLGNNSYLENLAVQKYGMAATPFTSSAAYQAEVATWNATGGTGVTLDGYGSGYTNIAIFGFNQGSLIVRGDRQRIRNANLDNWNGLSYGAAGDLPHIQGVHAWPFVGAGSVGFTHATYDDYRGGAGLYAYVGTDLKVFDSFFFGYQTGVWVQDSLRTSLIGVDADGTFGLTNPSGTPIATTGFLWQGNSPDGTCISCQISSLGDGFVVNLSTPSGNLVVNHGKAFQNTGVDYHVIAGGLVLQSSETRGTASQPVQAESGTTMLQINDFDASGGTGPAFVIDPAVVSLVGKRGGLITGYTDNLGELLRQFTLSGNGHNLNFGTSLDGLQFQINGSAGVANPGAIPQVWGTNGGGHFGSTGQTVIHSDVANSVKPIVFNIGKNNNAASLTLVGYQASIATSLTAAGATQGTALALASQINVITTAAAGTGVILPTPATNQAFPGTFAGLEMTVINRGANAVLVYPPSGAAIDGNAANAGVSIAAGVTAKFACASATQWYQTK